MTPVIETSGLTKRYRRVTALSDCTIRVPEGRISALARRNFLAALAEAAAVKGDGRRAG